MGEVTILCKHCGDRIRSNTADELLHCKCMTVYVRGNKTMFRLKHCRVDDFILILKDPREYESL